MRSVGIPTLHHRTHGGPFGCAPVGCSPAAGLNLMYRIGLIYALICSVPKHRSRVSRGAPATPDPGLNATFRLPWAKLYAWLAARKEPGRMGAAVSAGDLVVQGSLCEDFFTWLVKLFG